MGGRGLGHRVVDAEYLVQAGDAEDPQDAALRAHQVDPAVVGADPLQAADEHAEAVRMAADSGGTAVICNPMPLAAVMDIAAHGEKVPRKSTSFGPKPRTGLVLRTVEPENTGRA